MLVAASAKLRKFKNVGRFGNNVGGKAHNSDIGLNEFPIAYIIGNKKNKAKNKLDAAYAMPQADESAAVNTSWSAIGSDPIRG